MKTLKTYNPTEETDPYYSKDFKDMFQEEFIDRLQILGFIFEGTITTQNDGGDAGAHILHFTHDGITPIPDEKLRQITDWIDEGGRSQGQLYFGTLIITYLWTS